MTGNGESEKRSISCAPIGFNTIRITIIFYFVALCLCAEIFLSLSSQCPQWWIYYAIDSSPAVPWNRDECKLLLQNGNISENCR